MKFTMVLSFDFPNACDSATWSSISHCFRHFDGKCYAQGSRWQDWHIRFTQAWDRWRICVGFGKENLCISGSYRWRGLLFAVECRWPGDLRPLRWFDFIQFLWLLDMSPLNLGKGNFRRFSAFSQWHDNHGIQILGGLPVTQVLGGCFCQMINLWPKFDGWKKTQGTKLTGETPVISIKCFPGHGQAPPVGPKSLKPSSLVSWSHVCQYQAGGSTIRVPAGAWVIGCWGVAMLQCLREQLFFKRSYSRICMDKRCPKIQVLKCLRLLLKKCLKVFYLRGINIYSGTQIREHRNRSRHAMTCPFAFQSRIFWKLKSISHHFPIEYWPRIVSLYQNMRHLKIIKSWQAIKNPFQVYHDTFHDLRWFVFFLQLFGKAPDMNWQSWSGPWFKVGVS